MISPLVKEDGNTEPGRPQRRFLWAAEVQFNCPLTGDLQPV
jgi:hypothetical protein